MTDPLPTSLDELMRFCAERHLRLLFDSRGTKDVLEWEYADVVLIKWNLVAPDARTGWHVSKDRTGLLGVRYFAAGPLSVVVEDGSGELDIEEIERVREAIKRDVREVEGP